MTRFLEFEFLFSHLGGVDDQEMPIDTPSSLS